MTEHERDELEEARHQELIDHAEDIKKILASSREKSSLEHGAIITRVDDQNNATRAHLGNEMDTLRGILGSMRNYMDRILKAMKRFLERMGVGGNDL